MKQHLLDEIAIIAYRDFLKFLKDKSRIIATFIFPVVFIGVLGNSLQSNLGKGVGFNLILFTFTGVLAQTLFQSSSSGIISLIEDRENDFSQEIFVSPISRYTIILGKVVGESLVALAQAIGIITFGLIIRLPISFGQLISIIPALILACITGAAFGVILLSNLSSQRSANQIFPFIFFPQIFLSGVFVPIRSLPWYLAILARISPLTYVVDFVRGIFYHSDPSLTQVTLFPLWLDLLVISGMLFIFIIAGTVMFTRNERNR